MKVCRVVPVRVVSERSEIKRAAGAIYSVYLAIDWKKYPLRWDLPIFLKIWCMINVIIVIQFDDVLEL